ncbi:lectin, mannose-binding 2-like b isoform X2 [Betta splendens]|uniref:Lectin, mannose-binding 2-like b isoform X2 n=1 Tax=Betta splendens TaxID=158456 RepID=A0A6P7LBI3_BETSP|nr:lectin, mannose-binding 2-like b isoform X2 [Betta splendens]
MAVSVSGQKPCRAKLLGFLYPMFQFKRLSSLSCLFVALCALMDHSLADNQEFLEDFLKREYSLSKPYRGLGFSSSSQWDLMGTAVVTPDYIRLTPDLQSRQGAVWSRIPFFLRDWELKVHFKISGQGKKNFNGDGLAMWLTKDRMQNGPVFGNMNQFIGLGIFVDTYPNAERSHDDGRPTELGGCTAMARNTVHDTFVLVRYSNSRLTLMVDVDGKQEWKQCADVTGLRLPTGYFFGASSATGDLSDNHDIISMKLYELAIPRNPEQQQQQQQQQEEEEEVTVPRVDNMEQFQVAVEEEGMSTVQYFFTLLFSIMGLGVLAVVGLVLYGRWKENRRKRFY